jgi:hyaluronate lyase
MTDETPPAGVSRRAVLLGGAALVPAWYLAGAIGGPATAQAAATTDYATVRGQWLATLVGGYDPREPVIRTYVRAAAAKAGALWDDLDTSPTRTYLWADLDSTTTSAVQTSNIDRLRALALAYASPGSSLSGRPDLAADLTSAVDWFLGTKYGVTAKYDNWWDWEIGIPLALNDFCVLLHDQLSAAQIATAMGAIGRYAPDPSRANGGPATGANLSWACSIGVVRGALSADSAPLDQAMTGLTTLFPYSTSGDGFYPDGGFIQHTVTPYTGAYGVSLLQYLTYLVLAVRGTQWTATADQLSRIFAWTQQSFRPYLYRGAFMDMVRGRSLSRFYENDHRIGRLTTATLLQLAASLPADHARIIRSQAKGWIAADTYQRFFEFDPLPLEQVRLASIVEGRAVLADPRVRASAESSQPVVSTSMARVVHRRPSFAFGIAMDSTRIAPYETENKENLQGWYTGEGTTYLYLPDQPGHWADEYWPTVNRYRLPGVTLDTKALTNGTGRGSTNSWTGGAVLDGHVAAGMGLSFAKQTLRAKKSWFCLEDVVVCMGAGITSTDGHVIETIVENRNLGPAGKSRITVDGTVVQTTPNGPPTTATPRWVFVDDVGGYVFPAGGEIQVLREDRSGRWTDLDHRGVYDDTTLYTRRFATIWIDHGTNPAGETYQYIQLPAASIAQTRALANSDDIALVANTTTVQAITQVSQGIAMANVWSAGSPRSAGIEVDKTASVITRRRDGVLTIAVSDPTQLETGAVTVSVDGSAKAWLSGDPEVTVVALSPTVKVSVPIEGAAGRTFVARFAAPTRGHVHREPGRDHAKNEP